MRDVAIERGYLSNPISGATESQDSVLSRPRSCQLPLLAWYLDFFADAPLIVFHVLICLDQATSRIRPVLSIRKPHPAFLGSFCVHHGVSWQPSHVPQHRLRGAQRGPFNHGLAVQRLQLPTGDQQLLPHCASQSGPPRFSTLIDDGLAPSLPGPHACKWIGWTEKALAPNRTPRWSQGRRTHVKKKDQIVQARGRGDLAVLSHG